jgi:hypothetical protein
MPLQSMVARVDFLAALAALYQNINVWEKPTEEGVAVATLRARLHRPPMRMRKHKIQVAAVLTPGAALCCLQLLQRAPACSSSSSCSTLVSPARFTARPVATRQFSRSLLTYTATCTISRPTCILLPEPQQLRCAGANFFRFCCSACKAAALSLPVDVRSLCPEQDYGRRGARCRVEERAPPQVLAWLSHAVDEVESACPSAYRTAAR